MKKSKCNECEHKKEVNRKTVSSFPEVKPGEKFYKPEPGTFCDFSQRYVFNRIVINCNHFQSQSNIV